MERKQAGDGSLIIVSGPSGAGKSALTGYALRTFAELRFSVSYTTRAPRVGERDGVEYFFVEPARFKEMAARGDFLEWAEVHGNCYGTSNIFIDDILRQGRDVILDIDVQGARIVRQKRPAAIAIFVLPPSFDQLRERLRHRGLDDESVIAKRLRNAAAEVRHYPDYDYLIVNDDLRRAERELEAIIVSAHCRVAARSGVAAAVLRNFGGING